MSGTSSKDIDKNSPHAPLVMLQPLKDEPPLNAKCKDKFLIQSTMITPGKEAMPLQDIVRPFFWLLSNSALKAGS